MNHKGRTPGRVAGVSRHGGGVVSKPVSNRTSVRWWKVLSTNATSERSGHEGSYTRGTH